MNENFKYIAAAVGVVGLSIGAVVYFSHQSRGEPPPPSEPPVVAAPAPSAVAPPCLDMLLRPVVGLNRFGMTHGVRVRRARA